MITQILLHVPWWVWPLLALLIWVGIQRSRPGVVSLSRLALLPLVFLIWGVIALLARGADAAAPGIFGTWFAALLGGGPIGWLATSVSGIRVDRRRGLLHLPGDWSTLMASLLVFAAKFALGIAVAVRPDARSVLGLADMAVSGLSTGYFLARLARLIATYRRAPSADLAARTVATAESD